MSAAIEREFEELDAQNRWQQLYLVSGGLTEPPASPSEDRAPARRHPPPPPPPVGAEVAAIVIVQPVEVQIQEVPALLAVT